MPDYIRFNSLLNAMIDELALPNLGDSVVPVLKEMNATLNDVPVAVEPIMAEKLAALALTTDNPHIADGAVELLDKVVDGLQKRLRSRRTPLGDEPIRPSMRKIVNECLLRLDEHRGLGFEFLQAVRCIDIIVGHDEELRLDMALGTRFKVTFDQYHKKMDRRDQRVFERAARELVKTKNQIKRLIISKGPVRGRLLDTLAMLRAARKELR